MFVNVRLKISTGAVQRKIKVCKLKTLVFVERVLVTNIPWSKLTCNFYFFNFFYQGKGGIEAGMGGFDSRSSNS